MGHYNSGRLTELEFVKDMKSSNIETSTSDEDKFEHWDIKIDGVKYDIKGLKKISRNDHYTNENYHIVEITNVNGDNGWLYGQSDKIAFETMNYWIIVDTIKLQEFISNKVTKKSVNSLDEALYCLYRRKNRKDRMTLISTIDLCFLSDKIINKRKPKKHPIGESIDHKKRLNKELNTIIKNN